MKTKRSSILVVVLSMPLAIAAAARAVPSPPRPPLETERVVLENDRVRVIDYASRPTGNVCGVGVHSHPAHVTIVLAPARDRSAISGGKAEDADLRVGDVFWSDGETHTDVNIGQTDSRVIVVEIKDAGPRQRKSVGR